MEEPAGEPVEEMYGVFTEGELGNTLFGLSEGPIYVTETELVLGYDRDASLRAAFKEQLPFLGRPCSERSVSLAEARDQDRSVRIPRESVTRVVPRNLTSGLSYVSIETSDRSDPVVVAVGSTIPDAGGRRKAEELADTLESWAST